MIQRALNLVIALTILPAALPATAETETCTPIMRPLNYCTDAFSFGGASWSALYPGTVAAYEVSTKPSVVLDIAVMDFAIENPSQEEILRRINTYFSTRPVKDPLAKFFWSNVEVGPYQGYQIRFVPSFKPDVRSYGMMYDAYLDPENNRLLLFTTMSIDGVDLWQFHLDAMKGVKVFEDNANQ